MALTIYPSGATAFAVTGTSNQPAIVTTSGFSPVRVSRELAYITASGDVTVTATPPIGPGAQDGEELILRYVGSGSLTIHDGPFISMNGDIKLVNKSAVYYTFNNAAQIWAEVSRNDI